MKSTMTTDELLQIWKSSVTGHGAITILISIEGHKAKCPLALSGLTKDAYHFFIPLDAQQAERLQNEGVSARIDFYRTQEGI